MTLVAEELYFVSLKRAFEHKSAFVMCREGNVAQICLSKKSLEWALENRQTQCLGRDRMDGSLLGTHTHTHTPPALLLKVPLMCPGSTQ